MCLVGRRSYSSSNDVLISRSKSSVSTALSHGWDNTTTNAYERLSRNRSLGCEPSMSRYLSRSYDRTSSSRSFDTSSSLYDRTSRTHDSTSWRTGSPSSRLYDTSTRSSDRSSGDYTRRYDSTSESKARDRPYLSEREIRRDSVPTTDYRTSAGDYSRGSSLDVAPRRYSQPSNTAEPVDETRRRSYKGRISSTETPGDVETKDKSVEESKPHRSSWRDTVYGSEVIKASSDSSKDESSTRIRRSRLQQTNGDTLSGSASSQRNESVKSDSSDSGILLDKLSLKSSSTRSTRSRKSSDELNGTTSQSFSKSQSNIQTADTQRDITSGDGGQSSDSVEDKISAARALRRQLREQREKLLNDKRLGSLSASSTDGDVVEDSHSRIIKTISNSPLLGRRSIELTSICDESDNIGFDRTLSSLDEVTPSIVKDDRAQRIAKYKEERRKQLNYISSRLGDESNSSSFEKLSVKPSLFSTSIEDSDGVFDKDLISESYLPDKKKQNESSDSTYSAKERSSSQSYEDKLSHRIELEKCGTINGQGNSASLTEQKYNSYKKEQSADRLTALRQRRRERKAEGHELLSRGKALLGSVKTEVSSKEVAEDQTSKSNPEFSKESHTDSSRLKPINNIETNVTLTLDGSTRNSSHSQRSGNDIETSKKALGGQGIHSRSADLDQGASVLSRSSALKELADSKELLDDLLVQNATFLIDSKDENVSSTGNTSDSSKPKKVFKRRSLRQTSDGLNEDDRQIRGSRQALSSDSQDKFSETSKNNDKLSHADTTVEINSAAVCTSVTETEATVTLPSRILSKSNQQSSDLDDPAVIKTKDVTDSDSLFETAPSSSGPPSPPGSEQIKRKKRKDKSALRKSLLNKNVDGETQQRESRSSLTSVSSLETTRKDDTTSTSRVKREILRKESLKERSNSNNADKAQIKKTSSLHVTISPSRNTATTTNAPKSPIGVPHLSSKLDRALPSRITLPSKFDISTSKFSSSSSDKDKLPDKKTTETDKPRRIARGKDFSSLIRKFSSSEASSSERSDNEASFPRRRILFRRQDAEQVSSSSEDYRQDGSRKSPLRTQSLREQFRTKSELKPDSQPVQRSSSFKSDTMPRRNLPEQSDKPNDELAAVLSRRSKITDDQDVKGRLLDQQLIHSKHVEKADTFSTTKTEELIIDNEVLSALKSRRTETDSHPASESEILNTDNQNEKTVSSEAIQSSISELKKDLESGVSLDKSLEKLKSVTNDFSRSSLPVSSTLTTTQSSTDSEEEIEVITTYTVPYVINNDAIIFKNQPDSTNNNFDAQKLQLSESAITETTVINADVPSLQSSDLSKTKFTADNKNVRNYFSAKHDVVLPDSVVNLDLPKFELSGVTVTETDADAEDVTFTLDSNESRNVVTNELNSKEVVSRVSHPCQIPETTSIFTLPDNENDSKKEKISLGGVTTDETDTDLVVTVSLEDEVSNTVQTSSDLTIGERKLSSSPRSSPIRFLSDLKPSIQSGLVRHESMDSGSKKPKGILKRTPSLPKHSSDGVMDPGLAKIFKEKRRQQSEEEERESSQGKDIASEIQEVIRCGKKLSSEDSTEDAEEKMMSVAERVSLMKTKCVEPPLPTVPKVSSGRATPKFSKPWSTNGAAPVKQKSFDESSISSLSSREKLMEKLTVLSTEQSVPLADDRRKAYQDKKQDDWRRRTQPVTLEEINEADSLESVSSFRADIRKKTTVNMFDQMKQDAAKKPFLKKPEFPEHIRVDRRRRTRMERHNTLPVTAAELGAIPEGETLGLTGLYSMVYAGDGLESKADSGILSGSDIDFTTDKEDSLRGLTLEFDTAQNDPSQLSMSAKFSMFKTLEEKTKSEKTRLSASGAKRYIDRKKRERFMTQPVTEEEVKSAAEIGVQQKPKRQGSLTSVRQPEVVNRPKATETKKDSSDSEEDMSRLSLADKLKLFSSLKEEKEKPPPKVDAPVIRRRNRKQASRFSTQPVTVEEVEKASKISPLAISFVKPPDPEILKGLPLAAQRDLIAQHAEATLSQPGSRSGSRPSSRKGSLGDVSEIEKKDDVKGILRQSKPSNEMDVKGILKDDDKSSNTEPRSILKTSNSTEEKDEEPIGILKQNEEKEEDEHRSILKTAENKEEMPKSILKQKTFDDAEDEDSIPPLKGALKKDVEKIKSETKGILKKEGSFESKKQEIYKEVDEVIKEALLESSVETTQVVEASFDITAAEPELMHDEDTLKGVDEESSITVEVSLNEQDDAEDNSDSQTKGTRQRRRERGDSHAQSWIKRYLTQPSEREGKAEKKTPETRKKMKYAANRHMTQPVTPEEKKQAEMVSDVPKKTGSSGSIADSDSDSTNETILDRLNQLKKSGEEDWKKRVSKNLDTDSTPTSGVILRQKSGNAMPRPTSLADRLNKLEGSQSSWRSRVDETDVRRYTVAGKMPKSGSAPQSPLVSKLKNKPKKEAFKGTDSLESSPLSTPTSPCKDGKIPLPKEIVKADIPVTEEEKDDKEEAVEVTRVEVPSINNAEIKGFFLDSDIITTSSEEKLEVTLDDFNEIFINSSHILETTKRLRPKRNRTARSRNPLKTMSLHIEVQQEYAEMPLGVAEKELRKLKTKMFAKDANLAQEALAGLASKEDFGKVALRKAEDGPAPGGSARYDPFKDVMLLHVKGRRHIQTRLVEPSYKSLNSGDCFILVTNDKVISWIGEFSNVIEKNKTADISSFIQKKKDLGCKLSPAVASIDESRDHLGPGKLFWSTLGGKDEYQGAGPDEEDELYESHIISTNMIYRLENGCLNPYEQYWGSIPKYAMLKNDEVLVFDFGSEFYVWQGKHVKMEKRKLAMQLAKQLYEKGYNYSDCDLNPISPLKDDDIPPTSESRPDWTLFGKVNQNMETILFREKFSDWPDSSRLIKSADSIKKVNKSNTENLKAFDVKSLLNPDKSPVTLVLEGSNVGRGNKWFEDMQGFQRESDIITLGVNVWHVLEYDHSEVSEESYGQFHDGDTYVVRWQFMITAAGLKSLKGKQSRQSMTGRERCAYFFWQGKNSTISEKGASALMVVELDEERGPQVRVEEGKEPPCFLNLFKGQMIIHIGKREEESTNTQGAFRLYCCRNDHDNELCLMEIPVDIAHLRSKSSFILLNVKTGQLIVWHGSKSSEHTKNNCKSAAIRLQEKCPMEVGLHKDANIMISEYYEGEEKSDFWAGLGSKNRLHYHSLLRDHPSSFSHTNRLFYMESTSGVFEVHEVLNPSRTFDLITPFPHLQTDLYDADQPAIFMIDAGNKLYLWLGWWPEGSEEQENVQTGSAQARFNIDKKCAMETTLNYSKEINTKNPPVPYLVYAGIEPLEFTNLFPVWNVDSSVQQQSLKDGKKEGQMDLVSDVLSCLTMAQYSFAELQERPLPGGVDPLKLESYLPDEEFEEVLSMSREEFKALPDWKQYRLKQDVGLF